MKKRYLSLYSCDNGGTARVCSDCTTSEPNRFVHLAFVQAGSVVDESVTGLVTSILNLEKTCEAYIIRNTNGTMAEASWQSGKGAGKQSSRILSGTHSISITDFDIIDNIQFWNSMISSAKNYIMYAFTSNYAWAVKKPLTISPSTPVTDAIDTFIEGMIKIDWSEKALPLPINVGSSEVDLLEVCNPLFENTDGFINESGSMASISTDGYTLTIASGDSVNATLDSDGITLELVEVTSGTLPNGLTLDISSDGLSVVLSGSSVVAGTSTIVFKASNTCGVAAEFTIKIVIS